MQLPQHPQRRSQLSGGEALTEAGSPGDLSRADLVEEAVAPLGDFEAGRPLVLFVGNEVDETVCDQPCSHLAHALACTAHPSGDGRHRRRFFGNRSENLPSRAREPEVRHELVTRAKKSAVQPEDLEHEFGDEGCLAAAPGHGGRVVAIDRCLSIVGDPRARWARAVMWERAAFCPGASEVDSISHPPTEEPPARRAPPGCRITTSAAPRGHLWARRASGGRPGPGGHRGGRAAAEGRRRRGWARAPWLARRGP